MMVEIMKVVGIGLAGTFLAVTIRQQKPEFALAISLITAVIMLAICMQPIVQAVEMLKSMCESAGIDYIFFSIILKIVGISYIVQLASSSAEDSGEKAIATKIELAGKICIMVLSIPILKSILDLLLGLINR